MLLFLQVNVCYCIILLIVGALALSSVYLESVEIYIYRWTMDVIENADTTSQSKPLLTKTGKYLLAGSGTFFICVFGITIPFVSPALRKYCLPFVPATNQQVSNVKQLLSKRVQSVRRASTIGSPVEQLKVIDLGSGDGRLVST